MEKTTLIEVQELVKIYPGTIALDNVNIKFKSGEIHGIIGKNGAGKSTLLNILSGITKPTSGKIIIKGNEHSHLTREKSRKEGVTIVTQRPEIVKDFNLAQNLFLPQYIRNKLGILDWKKMYREAINIFKESGMDIDPKRRMGDLSLDEEQIFLILKAFQVDKKEFILLDEVTTSFSKREQEYFFSLIEDQKEKGNLIIFISHRLDEIIQICDKVTVLRDGRVAGTLEKGEINKNTLSRMIVGKQEIEIGNDKEKEDLISNDVSITDRKKILTVNDFSLSGSFSNINFHLYQNEILGIAGLVGSGRTELLRAIAGIMLPEEGELLIDGRKHTTFNNTWDAIKNGIIYLTENRDEDGIINIHSVKDNLSLSYLVSVWGSVIIGKNEERELANHLVESLHINTSSLDEEVQNLSGGNRQKVLLGRVASTKSKVLLLDEPTKGIDISAKQSILGTIRNKLSKDAGVIITTPGIDDLIEICDRILILVEREISMEFIRKDFDELEIYRAIQGI